MWRGVELLAGVLSPPAATRPVGAACAAWGPIYFFPHACHLGCQLTKALVSFNELPINLKKRHRINSKQHKIQSTYDLRVFPCILGTFVDNA